MGEGEGGLNREGGLINFPPLKRGGLIGEGGLNRGFTVFNLKARNCKGGELLLHLRSSFDSWACANHILHSHKLIWVSARAHIPHVLAFITQLKNSSLLEVIFSIYLTRKSRKFMNK